MKSKKDDLLWEIKQLETEFQMLMETQVNVAGKVRFWESKKSDAVTSFQEEHKGKEISDEDKKRHKSILRTIESELAGSNTHLLKIEKKLPIVTKNLNEKRKELNLLEPALSKALEEEKIFENVSSISHKLRKDAHISAVKHGLAAERWGGYHYLLGISATGISAAVGAGIIANNPSLVLVAGVMSLILVIVSAVSTFLNPEEKSSSHYEAGNNFRVLANKAEVLIDIDLVLRQKSCEELAESLKQLTNERDELVKKSPRVPNRFHKLALKDWAEVTYQEAEEIIQESASGYKEAKETVQEPSTELEAPADVT